MTCPHCRHKLKTETLLERMTDEEIRSLWAARNGQRQTPHAGPGRPRTKPRCPCGAMTVERAEKRGHRC